LHELISNKNTNEFRHGSDYLAVPPFAPSLFILVLFGGGEFFLKGMAMGLRAGFL
jgi:hypothetical protein